LFKRSLRCRSEYDDAEGEELNNAVQQYLKLGSSSTCAENEEACRRLELACCSRIYIELAIP